METSKEYVLKKARMGIKIFHEFINKKNKNNEIYDYECLASINEFSPYDMMIIKRDKEDWGNTTTTYHEIKTREDYISVNDYPTSVIDAYKISTLQKLAYQTNCRTYVNIIYPKDRKILIWEIEPDIKYQMENKDVNWRSKSEYENKQIKLNKLLVHLPISEAKQYSY